MAFRQTNWRPVSPEVAFDRILKALGPQLAASRFILVEEADDPKAFVRHFVIRSIDKHRPQDKQNEEDTKDFGSRCATFTDGSRYVRLTWDGREQWFVLEGDFWADKRPPSGEPTWIDLTLQRFDPAKGDEKWVGELIEDITAALKGYTQADT